MPSSAGGRGISREAAIKHVFAYGVGVDLTRRDMQSVAKKAGRPWDCSKGFDSSGPVGGLTPVSDGAVGAGLGLGLGSESRAILLMVNGELRQESVLGEMIWSVPEMISRLSEVRGCFRRGVDDSIASGLVVGYGAFRCIQGLCVFSVFLFFFAVCFEERIAYTVCCSTVGTPI